MLNRKNRGGTHVCSERFGTCETKAGVTTVMNRPEALNALSAALRNELAEVFTELAQDEATEVVVFTGTGRVHGRFRLKDWVAKKRPIL